MARIKLHKSYFLKKVLKTFSLRLLLASNKFTPCDSELSKKEKIHPIEE